MNIGRLEHLNMIHVLFYVAQINVSVKVIHVNDISYIKGLTMPFINST